MTLDVIQTSLHKLQPTFNNTLDYLGGVHGTQMRQLDYRSKVENCTIPHYYGGGKSAGVLWYDYMNIKTIKQPTRRQQRQPTYEEIWNTEFVKAIHQALIPNQQWRDLATKCITHHLHQDGSSSKVLNNTIMKNTTKSMHGSGYAVLHARIETDMMVHRCGKDMEKNLTNILDQVDNFIAKYNFGAGNVNVNVLKESC